MATITSELTIVQFKKHTVAYTVAAVVTLALGGTFYFIFKDDGSVSLAWLFLAAGILLSAYCIGNAFSNAVVLELNPDGIKYKHYFYCWNSRLMQSYKELYSGSRKRRALEVRTFFSLLRFLFFSSRYIVTA